MANELVDCFYPIDLSTESALPYPIVRLVGKPFVRLADAFENLEPLIRHFECRAARQPQFIAEQVFDYRILVSAAEPKHSELTASAAAQDWHFFDPEMDYAPTNQWLGLQKVLRLCGLTVFGDERITVNPNLLIDFSRFEFRLELEQRDKTEYLIARRTTLESSDARLKDLFHLLSRQARWRMRTPPPLVLRAVLPEVQSHLRETTAVYPLHEFARQIKTCLERASVTHHYIFFRLIERLLEISRQTSGGRVFHAADLLSYHLVNYQCINLNRPQMLAVIQQFHPNFDFHPLLADTYLSEAERCEKAAAQTLPFDGERFVGERSDLTLVSADEKTVINLTAISNPPALQQYLNYINCQLQFINYQITNHVELKNHSLTELAVLLVENVEELQGSWTARPSADEVDYQDFWRRAVWSYGHHAKSSISMTSFRYALYDPPYGGASDTLQEIIDDKLITLIFGDLTTQQNFRVFKIETGASDYFINEWWDFLWIAINLEVGRVLVVFGTATD